MTAPKPRPTPRPSRSGRVPHTPTAPGVAGITPTEKTKAEMVVAAKADTAESPMDMLLAATAIFEGGRNTFDSRTGKTVVIESASMDKLGPVMVFFGAVVDGLSPTDLANLVDAVVHAQKMAIAKGINPNDIDLRELASEELVQKLFNYGKLFADLMAATFTHLPLMATTFTNLTREEFGKLEPDEGMLIVGGIFMLNYGFFTRNLPPMLTVYMKSWASKRNATAVTTADRKKTSTK